MSATEPLSLCTPSESVRYGLLLQLLKPVNPEPMLQNKKSHHNEMPTTTVKSSPCLSQLEKACMQQQRLNLAKNK